MEYQAFDRFEYKLVNINHYKPEDQFNNLGKDGWEYVGLYSNSAVFKRKLNCVITD